MKDFLKKGTVLFLAAVMVMCGVKFNAFDAYAAGDGTASGINVTLSSEQTAYANGEYASFNVKYTMDYGKVQAGDKLVITVPDVLEKVTVAYSKLHFSACNDLGNGTYELVFGDSAPTGLTGYLSINAWAANTSTEVKTGTVTAGDKSMDITVTPTGGTSGGTETRAIEKWAPDGNNYNQSTAVMGIYGDTPDSDSEIRYAIEVDPRKSAMSNVIVTDAIPDEMEFEDGSIKIIDMVSNKTLTSDEAAKFIVSTGKNLEFDFGNLDGSTYYRIYYKVKVPAGTKVKMTNTARINYDNGVVEKSDFTVKAANGYGASVGYKQVDKTFITDNPEDQTVTYTITFENDQAFDANVINLTDNLDKRVKYVQSYGSAYFDLTYDKDTNSVKIVNTKEIPASAKQVVTIVTDFSNVPVGTTITNTVGGNTVKTTKASAVIKAKKVFTNGTLTDGQFNFKAVEAADATGTVLTGGKTYTASCSKDGSISFDEITYSKAGTHYYLVSEDKGGTTENGITYDGTQYIAKVVVTSSNNELTAATTYTKKDGSALAEGETVPSFVNVKAQAPVPETTSVSFQKTWSLPSGFTLPENTNITVQLMGTVNGATEAVGDARTLTAADSWKTSWTGLAKADSDGKMITYSVKETKINENGITGGKLVVLGSAFNNINKAVGLWTATQSSDTAVTNTWIPATDIYSDASIIITKKDSADASKHLSNAEFTLTGSNLKTVRTAVTDSNGNASFTGLKEGVYTLKESKAPDGYNASATEWTVNVTKDGSVLKRAENNTNFWDPAVKITGSTGSSDYSAAGNALSVFDQKKPVVPVTPVTPVTPQAKTISKTVTKVWSDSGNKYDARPDSVQVQLYSDGKTYGLPVTLNELNGWKYTWNSLIEENSGKQVTYTVKELSSPEGYTASYSEDTFTITNTYNVTNGGSVTPGGNNQPGGGNINDNGNNNGSGGSSDNTNTYNTGNTGNGGTQSPATGDTDNIWLYGAILITAAAATAAILRRRNKDAK